MDGDGRLGSPAYGEWISIIANIDCILTKQFKRASEIKDGMIRYQKSIETQKLLQHKVQSNTSVHQAWTPQRVVGGVVEKKASHSIGKADIPGESDWLSYPQHKPTVF